MKFKVFKEFIAEDKAITISKALEAGMLKDSKILDVLAEKVQSEGFPEKFDLPVKTSTGAELVFQYELYEKTINENKSYHQVTFTYEHTRETTIKIRDLLKIAEKDDSDEGGEVYDELHEELNCAEMIHITAEFAEKFTKVWATNK